MSNFSSISSLSSLLSRSIRSALSSRSCSASGRKMPSLWLAVACTLCVLAGKPATAYADVDLLQNVRQFTMHKYANTDSEMQYGGFQYWETMDWSYESGNEYLSWQIGTGVNNRQRFQVNNQFQTYMKDCIATEYGMYGNNFGRLTTGQEVDIQVTGSMFKKGYKVLPLWSGYLMGSYSLRTDNGNGDVYYREMFSYRYYWTSLKWYGYSNANGLERIRTGDDGTVTFDKDYEIFILRITVAYSGTAPSDLHYLAIAKPQLVLLSDDLAISSQTDTLMDTTGADSVGSQQVTDAQSMVENMSMLNVIEEVDGAYHTAIATTDEQSTLTFPGISLPIAGATYTIPSYSFDIWQFAPALEEPVRWITTFLFVSAFFGSLYNMWWKAVIGVRDWDEFAVREFAADLGVDYE